MTPLARAVASVAVGASLVLAFPPYDLWFMAVLVPAALASGVLFALSGGLLWYVVSFDERLRHWGPRG